jgi:hypothetical protein
MAACATAGMASCCSPIRSATCCASVEATNRPGQRRQVAASVSSAMTSAWHGSGTHQQPSLRPRSSGSRARRSGRCCRYSRYLAIISARLPSGPGRNGLASAEPCRCQPPRHRPSHIHNIGKVRIVVMAFEVHDCRCGHAVILPGPPQHAHYRRRSSAAYRPGLCRLPTRMRRGLFRSRF